jgi:lambda family phage portal protein
MNFFRKIFGAIRGFVQNRYEAAMWQWGTRSFLFGTNQDARFDADKMAREEIMRKSRYFERNNAFVNRLADIFEQYTVGANGLAVVSQSKDATNYFNRWSMDCDVCSLLPFSTLQSIMARSWFIDGEIFIVKTMVKGRPRVQLVESHRCYTPKELRDKEGTQIVDGVQVDANGKPVGYWFNTQPTNSGNYSPAAGTEQMQMIPAENVVHVFEPSRPGMYRGLPFLYPVMNDLHDMDDLQMMVLQVCKQAASIGNVTTNKTGEFDATLARRAAMKVNSQNAAGSPVSKDFGQFYNVKLGAQEIALAHGDSISQFQANRPSLAERELWDYLLTKVCAGVGISKLLVMPYSMQGTVTRADLEIAAAFFRSRSAIVQNAVKCVFMWVSGWAMDFDREVLRGGMDFTEYASITVRAPRSVNVDVGRNSKALVSELNAGLRSYQDIYAEAGQDYREQLEQKAAEAALITELAKKYAIDENDIAERVSAGLNQKGGMNATENDNDEIPSASTK